MIFVPLPFVVTILLVLLLLNIARRDDGLPQNKPFLALIALAALQSVLIGLRFGYGIAWPAIVSPILASLMAPLVYLGAVFLVGPRSSAGLKSLAPHGMATVIVVVAMVFWGAALDAVIVGIFVLYAVLVLRHLWPGVDTLKLATLEGAGPAHRALVFAALVLMFSALVDIAISIDVALLGARHLPQLVSVANVATLLLLSIAAASASRSRVPPRDVGAADQETRDRFSPAVEEAGDAEVMATVEALMTQKHLYRDTDLNLDRLARRALIPSRQISGAINRTTGKNVSQYVNDFRIAEACEMLETGTRPVTEIMFEVGFQTKSNFNREFRRVTDMAPQEWRKSRRPTTDNEN